MQSRLDSFIKKNTPCLVPRYLCLDVNNDRARFDERMDSCKFAGTARIRVAAYDFQLDLLTNDLSSPHQFFLKHGFKKEAVPFLKSMLQKAIRRGLLSSAWFACYVLLELDPMTLFRRLCIIMIEDVSLHVGFTVLTWHLLAKASPTDCCVFWTLGLIQALCEETRTISFDDVPCAHSKDSPLVEDALTWCLIIRKAYGGLSGDLVMIDKVIEMLKHGRIAALDSQVQRLDPRQIVQYPKIWMYEAIDFHVLPLVLSINDYPADEIRKMIWLNSSSINFRKLNTPYRIEAWKRIVWKIRKLQTRYFDSIRDVDTCA